MTRLGPDVEGAQKLTGPWSVAQNAGYARQMLALLRSLHNECKMVFVDVKPGVSWWRMVWRAWQTRALSDATLSGNVRTVSFFILVPKWSFHFRTEWYGCRIIVVGVRRVSHAGNNVGLFCSI